MHSTNKRLAPPCKPQKKDKTTFILTTLAELAVESFFEQTSSSYSYFGIFCCSLPTDRSKKIFISHDLSPCEKPLQGDICMLTVSGRLILPGCQTKGEKGSEGKILLLTSQSLLCYSRWHVICCHPEMSHSNPSVKALTVETLKVTALTLIHQTCFHLNQWKVIRITAIESMQATEMFLGNESNDGWLEWNFKWINK